MAVAVAEIHRFVDKVVYPHDVVGVELWVAVGIEKASVDDGDDHALAPESRLVQSFAVVQCNLLGRFAIERKRLGLDQFLAGFDNNLACWLHGRAQSVETGDEGKLCDGTEPGGIGEGDGGRVEPFRGGQDAGSLCRQPL